MIMLISTDIDRDMSDYDPDDDDEPLLLNSYIVYSDVNDLAL